MLTFQELREANVARSKEPSWGDTVWSASDWAVALAGEVGELCNLIKKMKRGTSYPGMLMPTVEDVASEIADCQTYLDLLALYFQIDLGEATIKKWNEVSERWGLPQRLG